MGWFQFEKKKLLPRMVSIRGAVSPEILAMDRRTPVMMPLLAVLSTTLTVVLHRLIPRAIAASLSELGTVLMDSSVVLVTIGNVITDRAMAPATGEY